MSRGGRRSTTWGSTWNFGKTKLIRVPEAISQEIIQIARLIDDEPTILNSLVTGKGSNEIIFFEKILALLRDRLKILRETNALLQDKNQDLEQNNALLQAKISEVINTLTGGKLAKLSPGAI